MKIRLIFREILTVDRNCLPKSSVRGRTQGPAYPLPQEVTTATQSLMTKTMLPKQNQRSVLAVA